MCKLYTCISQYPPQQVHQPPDTLPSDGAHSFPAELPADPEIIRNEHPSAPPLTNENIRIDTFSTIVIAPPSSPQNQSTAGSLSSDISMFSKFFLRIFRILTHRHRLLLPLDPKHEDIVFAHIMVTLVEHFVASGDLILPDSSPTDLLPVFTEFFRTFFKKRNRKSNPFLIHNLASSFAQVVLRRDIRNIFRFSDHSFLRGDAVESSEQLLDAVKKVKETLSLEKVQTAFFDWKEWVKMLETIEKDATQTTDHSILQSRCLRATLLSLQKKHQLRANPTQNEKNRFADSCRLPTTTTTDTPLISSAINPFTNLPIYLPLSIDPRSSSTDTSLHSSTINPFTNLPIYLPPSIDPRPSSTDNSLHSSTISTQTALPSSQFSSDPQPFIFEQAIFQTNPVVRQSRQFLLAIHYLLTRPLPTSFPWIIRPSFKSESEQDTDFQPDHQSVDLNEKFHTSLFDDTDDAKVVAALRRCCAVVKATQTTKCIANVNTFRNFLIAGLHSSNPVIQYECHNLFFEISYFFPKFDDPRQSRFSSLRMAFRDGTFWEKMTLLWLWFRWLQFRAKNGDQRYVNESDFDFSGFLATDLSDVRLFYLACNFVGAILLDKAVSMSIEWQMDFVHQFERRNRMLSRISSDPMLFSKQDQSALYLTPLATMLGSFLSVYCGCDFPPALTDIVATDSDPTLHRMLSNFVNPIFFLSHSSIDPKHRRSFFPMDLMFERFLRSDPDTLVKGWINVSECTSRKFLFTPYVGLHSLLLRSPKLNLDLQALLILVVMFFIKLSGQESTQSDISQLFWSDLAAFGACSSLAKVFKMLYPFDSNPEQAELSFLSDVGNQVVSLHWLNFPSHIDSPLLCHLPSLAGAQRGILQTLSSHSGIPSLLPLRNQPDWNSISTMISKGMSPNEAIRVLSQCVRYFASLGPYLLMSIFRNLLSPLPGDTSIAIEFFLRLVSVTSDDVRMKLVIVPRPSRTCSSSRTKGRQFEEHTIIPRSK
ncbi:hypothetical protein BLNAU_20688 [Blattamonas nauphoetae]|uniref:Uncharacterized protein n=1 Tax=Blattamonas nauphoetae TaxID=2049346 RepID=A0ABQ9WXZ0_9EUKA|nr:hypothetical protein BLNAU_20688 [Blattamonas nauphoetae]